MAVIEGDCTGSSFSGGPVSLLRSSEMADVHCRQRVPHAASFNSSVTEILMVDWTV